MRRHGALIAAALVVACAHAQQVSVVTAGAAVAAAQFTPPARAADSVIARMIEEGTQRSHVDADLE